MPGPYRATRRIEFVDTDTANIVHFSNYFRFMESAEQEMLRSIGLSVSMTWQGEKIGFPRVSAACDYFKPVRFDEVIHIDVLIEEIGRKSVNLSYHFYKDEELIARGRISTVCCRVLDENRLESIPIPEEIRQRLQQFTRVEPTS